MTSEVAAVKIPNYNASDPQLWFGMCESTFELAAPKPIIDSRTKYNHCVAHLPPEIASIVRDVILKPKTEDPFNELRSAILERCGESRTQEIRRLLAGEQLGDRKPSQLLRDMQRRAESHDVSETLLIELFQQQLPQNVQNILASVAPTSAQKAAEIADRILDISKAQVSALSSHSETQSGTFNSELLAEIRELRKEVASMRRDRSVSRNRNNRKERSNSATRQSTLCWYHRRFGKKCRADKCVSPCTWQGNEPSKE